MRKKIRLVIAALMPESIHKLHKAGAPEGKNALNCHEFNESGTKGEYRNILRNRECLGRRAI
jgi:hypothetical protein